MSDIILYDDKLRVFRAVELGLKQGIFDKSFVNSLREDGAKMSVHFAKQFYNAHYAVNLRQSTDVVLGVCNLGATLIGEVEQIALSLRERGLVALFQKGFSALRDLSQKTQSCGFNDPMDEKACAELVMAARGENWTGFSEYQMKLEEVENWIHFNQFLDWFMKKSRTFSLTDASDKKKAVKTAILSVYLMNINVSKPILTMEEFVKALSNINDKNITKIYDFVAIVPNKFKAIAQLLCDRLVKDVTRFLSVESSADEDFLHFSGGFIVKDELDGLTKLYESVNSEPVDDFADIQHLINRR